MISKKSLFVVTATLLASSFMASADIDYAAKEKTPGVKKCVTAFQAMANIENRNHLLTNMCYCLVDQATEHHKSKATRYCMQEAILENTIFKAGAANQSTVEAVEQTCTDTSFQFIELANKLDPKSVTDEDIKDTKGAKNETCACQAPYLLDMVSKKLSGDALEEQMKKARGCSGHGIDDDSVEE